MFRIYIGNTAIGMANQSFIFSNELCYFCRQHSIFTRLGEIVGRERWNHSPVNGEFRMARSPKFFP